MSVSQAEIWRKTVSRIELGVQILSIRLKEDRKGLINDLTTRLVHYIQLIDALAEKVDKMALTVQ